MPLIADIGRLGIAGILVVLGLLGCVAMLIAFRAQKRRGRWDTDRGQNDEEDRSE